MTTRLTATGAAAGRRLPGTLPLACLAEDTASGVSRAPWESTRGMSGSVEAPPVAEIFPLGPETREGRRDEKRHPRPNDSSS